VTSASKIGGTSTYGTCMLSPFTLPRSLFTLKTVALTDGHTDPHSAKTAICVMRYRPELVVAVLDRQHAGRTAKELFGVGAGVPVVGRLSDVPDAEALLIGVAPPGGQLPEGWRPIVCEAIERGMTILSGMHEFLGDDAELSTLAAEHGATLIDLRKNDEHEVATGGREFRPDCLRIHTIAPDCSSGKMVAAVELARGLRTSGVDAAFVATGQTGMIVAGGGVAIDRVAADFTAGAAERLVLANQHHEAIVVEGQGSLFHPRYSGVTLSLLHGVRPHAMIMVHPMGRTEVHNMPGVKLPTLERTIELYETAAGLMHPSRVIGVAVSGVGYSEAEVAAECDRLEQSLNLPATDPVCHGPGKLVAAVRGLHAG